MAQINFRVSEEEKKIADTIATNFGISVAEYARKAFLNDLKKGGINLAFKLVQKGKCGFKRAWKLSGLEYRVFLSEWAKRDIEEQLPEGHEEKHLDSILNMDLKPFLKTD